VPPNWPEIVARYPSIKQPTLLVWCGHDDIVPPTTGLRLQRTLPHARLAIIDVSDAGAQPMSCRVSEAAAGDASGSTITYNGESCKA